MGYLGFIRSHPTGEAQMFQKILKIECLRGPQQMATDFFRFSIALFFKNCLVSVLLLCLVIIKSLG